MHFNKLAIAAGTMLSFGLVSAAPSPEETVLPAYTDDNTIPVGVGDACRGWLLWEQSGVSHWFDMYAAGWQTAYTQSRDLEVDIQRQCGKVHTFHMDKKGSHLADGRGGWDWHATGRLNHASGPDCLKDFIHALCPGADTTDNTPIQSAG